MKSNYIKRTVGFLLFMLSFTSILNNVSAQIETYTLDDDGSNITITEGQQFNVSVTIANLEEWQLVGFDFGEPGYESNVLEIVNGNVWLFDDNPGTPIMLNLTFEGISAGRDVITYNHHQYWEYPDQPIVGNFTLNFTVIESDQSVNLPLMLILVIIIAVVPSAIIVKWMKGERKDEK